MLEVNDSAHFDLSYDVWELLFVKQTRPFVAIALAFRQ